MKGGLLCVRIRIFMRYITLGGFSAMEASVIEWYSCSVPIANKDFVSLSIMHIVVSFSPRLSSSLHTS